MARLLFLASRALNVFGLQILASVFLFRTLDLGLGPYGVGQLGLVATLGAVLTAWPMGWLVDRISRKTAILLSHSLLFGISVFILALNPDDFFVFLILTALLTACRNFRGSSQFKIFGELISGEANKEKWVNRSTLSWQVSAFLAPLLAGWMGAGRWGLVIACGFLGVSFLAQWGIVEALKVETSKEEIVPTFEILDLFRRNFKLRSSMVLDFVTVFFAGAAALLPFLHLGVAGSFEIGILRSALPAGVLLGTAFGVGHLRPQNWAQVLFVTTAGYSLCHFFLADSPTLVTSCLLLILAGIFDAMSLSIRECILQLEVPDGLKGRVYSINNLIVSGSDELSEWESGALATRVGVPAALRLGGMAGLAASLAFRHRAFGEKQRRAAVRDFLKRDVELFDEPSLRKKILQNVNLK